MLKYRLYCKDILRAIRLIEITTKNKTFMVFSKNINLIDATAMRIQIIGESIRKLPSELKTDTKEINWSYLEGMRNIISHTYFKVNSELLWNIIKEELPFLKKYIKKIMSVKRV